MSLFSSDRPVQRQELRCSKLLQKSYGELMLSDEQRTRITGDTTSIPVTPELEGVYNLEASLFVLKFEYTD